MLLPILALMLFQELVPANLPAFDVVSVKPSGDNIIHGVATHNLSDFRYSGNRVSCDQQIRDMMEEAYGVRDFQIVGPAWLGTLTYAVAAVMPEGTDRATARRMIQRMLAERFKLQFHREQRILPVYALVEAKSGVKLKPLADPDHPRTRLSPGGHIASSYFGGGNYWNGAETLEAFADYLTHLLDRPAVNATRLAGVYEIEMHWTPEEGSGRLGHPEDLNVLAAVEQLGLRLEARKMPCEVLVIDHVEKIPTEN